MSEAHVRPGLPALIPCLTVDDPDKHLAFVEAALGAQELEGEHVAGPDGKTMHTAFRIEGCVLETGRASEPWGPTPASAKAAWDRMAEVLRNDG